MNRSTILVTGATGNIGREVIRALKGVEHLRVIAAVTEPQKSLFPEDILQRSFDYFNAESIRQAIEGVDTIFLLRPPQISDVQGVFSPAISQFVKSGIKHIVFLSVQGAERSSWIPHHKIELLIRDSGIAYTFVRPAYFMQNLTTTLRRDIIERNEIYLPAGNAKFNWIAAEDIGLAIASVLKNVSIRANKIYTLTGQENLSFADAAEILEEVLGRKIRYRSAFIPTFIIRKLREGLPLGHIMVMIVLHVLPRFQHPPEMTHDVLDLTGDDARSLAQFAREHSAELS